jgi:hypothetical protein
MPEGPVWDATTDAEYRTPLDFGRRPSRPSCLTSNSGRTATRRRFVFADPPGWQSQYRTQSRSCRARTESHPSICDSSLAHVFRQSDNLLVNKEIIWQGYRHAYTKYPFDLIRMEEVRAAEREAQEHERGLWGR